MIGQFKAWYGEPDNATSRYALHLWQARTAQPGAAAAIFSELDNTLLAAIRHATLLAELPRYPSQQALSAASKALHDPAPQVREAAVNVISALLPAEQRLDLLGPLLRDQILARCASPAPMPCWATRSAWAVFKPPSPRPSASTNRCN